MLSWDDLFTLFAIVGQCPYTAPSTNTSGMVGNGRGRQGGRREEEEIEDDNEPTDSSELVEHTVMSVVLCVFPGWGGGRGYRGRRRRTGKGGWEARKRARRDEEEEMEEQGHPPNKFITARDQHVSIYLQTKTSQLYRQFCLCTFHAVVESTEEEVWRKGSREQSCTSATGKQLRMLQEIARHTVNQNSHV